MALGPSEAPAPEEGDMDDVVYLALAAALFAAFGVYAVLLKRV